MEMSLVNRAKGARHSSLAEGASLVTRAKGARHLSPAPSRASLVTRAKARVTCHSREGARHLSPAPSRASLVTRAKARVTCHSRGGARHLSLGEALPRNFPPPDALAARAGFAELDIEQRIAPDCVGADDLQTSAG